MATKTVSGNTYHVKCNNKPRPLYSLADRPELAEEFDYITGDDQYSARLFNYRGSWYDYYEFEVAADNFKALGFDGMQGESYFSAVAVRYFDADGYEYDGEIVVGYIHW